MQLYTVLDFFLNYAILSSKLYTVVGYELRTVRINEYVSHS